jgi:hypothetical protein
MASFEKMVLECLHTNHSYQFSGVACLRDRLAARVAKIDDKNIELTMKKKKTTKKVELK